MSDLWIFGYGSLMWRPGFPHDRAVRATLRGHHRAFCIYSVHHRGTIERPGLVLGLDRGGICEGVAFRVPRTNVAATLAYLREREQVTGVYRETTIVLRARETAHGGLCRPAADSPATADGATIPALAYLVERRHPQYAGELPLGAQAALIRHAVGLSGRNIDYLTSTIAHLRALGIVERRLERVCHLAGGRIDGSGFGSATGACGGGAGEISWRTRTLGRPRPIGKATLPSGPKLNADLMLRFMYRRNLMRRQGE